MLFAVLIAFIAPIHSYAQYKTSQYSRQNGLHLSHIEHIAQDSLGYIWIAARNGLARFDGVIFNHYYPDPGNPSSLPFSDISNLACDPNGNLWIGSHEGGIAIYNPKKDKFLAFDFEGESFSSRPMSHICFDNEGVGYASFINNELYRLKLDGDNLNVSRIQSSNLRYLNIQNWPLEANHLLLSTSQGLYTFDTKSYEMDTLYPSLEWYNSYFTNGKIYGYNYYKNVHALDIDSKIVTQLEKGLESRKKDIIKVDNEIWVTNGNQGIIRFNEKDEVIENLPLIPLNSSTQKGENSYVLFRDKDKGIWVGRDRDILYLTRKSDGVHSYHTFTNKYETTYDALPISSDLIILAMVYEDRLMAYNIKTHESKPVFSDQKFKGPFSIQIVGADTLIIYGNGIGKYNQRTNRISNFLDTENETKIRNNLLYDVVQGLENDLWILDARFNLIHIDSDGFVEIKAIHKDIPKDHYSRTLMRYDEDILIIGGSASIAIYSLTKGLVQYVSLKDTELRNAVNDIELVTTNENIKTLWISSFSSSLFKAELRNNNLIFLAKYDMRDGLLNNRPDQIIFTKEGDLIVSSSSSLARYNSEDDRFVPFNDEHEFLGSNIVNIKEVGDEIFVFQDEGFTTIRKTAFIKEEKPPALFIEKMIVNADEVDLHNNPSSLICLKNNQKNIAIQFSALNFASPQDVYYAYKINDNYAWTVVNYLEKVARFGQLEFGEYSFKVKARTSTSEWTDEKVLNFKIDPPIWMSWWFLLLLLLLCALLVYGYIKWREGNLSKISTYEKRLIELEGEALRAQMNPHFIFNSLNSIKAFIIRNEPESAADYLTLFADLIRVVLHNSKQKMIPLSAEIEAVDLYSQLENIRLKNKFELKWDVDPTLDLHAILIPPLTLQPFVENAIWHGFIHKKTRGELRIGLFRKNGNLIATIKDNGVGRAKSAEIEEGKTGNKKSYGIAITSQRLDQNKGKERIKIIDLYDQNNKAIGTEVELTIDLNQTSNL